MIYNLNKFIMVVNPVFVSFCIVVPIEMVDWLTQ
jgi:hypothetical protein